MGMKERMRSRMCKNIVDMTDFYKKYGLWSQIALDPRFEKITLVIIFCNVVWIAVDTDVNNADMLINSDPTIQIVENCFCAFFSFEYLCRVLAFRTFFDSLKDRWMVYDGVLITLMVFE